MSNRTAKRLDDPMLSNRAFAIFFIVTILIVIGLLFAPKAHATSYNWVAPAANATSQNWNANASWTPNTSFPNAAGDIANITLANNKNITIPLNVGITIGVLNIGSSKTYDISTGTAGTLNFNNSGSAAQININSGSSGDTISAPVTLSDSLNIADASTKDFNISGGITAATAGTKTITNQGTGTGALIVSGVIGNGSGSVAVRQNSANSALTLGGANANTYTGLTTASAGTLNLGKTASVNAVGGDLTINGGTVAYSTAIDNQIADSAKVTISSGTLAFGARTETIGITSTPTSGLALSGTGAITMSSGTVTVANSASMTGGTVTISNSGNLNFNSDFNFSGGTINSTYTGGTASGVGLRGGTGTGITYSASGTSTAQITGSGGGAGIRLSLNTAASSTNVFNIADSASVATEMIISMPISGGTGALQKTGAGVLQLSGTNTYSVATQVLAGTLLITNSSALGGTTNGTTVSSGAVLSLDGTGGNLAIGAETLHLSGTGLTASPAGALRNIGGTNSYAGAITLDAASTITSSAGTLTLTGGITNSGNLLTVDGAGTTTVSTTAITGAGGLTKTGSGILNLNVANSYTGLTTVSAGTVAEGVSDAIASGNVTVNGATAVFAMGNNSDTVGVVTLTDGSITGGSGTLTGTSYGVANGSISAKLGGSGALTKSTAGTVILTGVASYTGGTNVNGGTLALNASNVLPDTGTVTLGGGKLQQNGVQEGTTGAAGAGALALTSSSIIDLASTDLIHFLASGSQTWVGTLSIYNWNGTPVTGGGAEQILFGTNATSTSLTQAQLDAITFYSDSGTTSLGTAAFATANDGEIVPLTAIPEPGTWFAGSLVFATLVFVQRRRVSRLLRRAP